jgi:hypothetical protein
MKFDVNTAAFTAEFIYSSNARAYSTAYLNEEYWYATSGANVTVRLNGQQIDWNVVHVPDKQNYYSFDMSRVAGIVDGDKVTFTAA